MLRIGATNSTPAAQPAAGRADLKAGPDAATGAQGMARRKPAGETPRMDGTAEQRRTQTDQNAAVAQQRADQTRQRDQQQAQRLQMERRQGRGEVIDTLA